MSSESHFPHDDPITLMLRFGLSRAIQIHSETLRSKLPRLSLSLDLVDDESLMPEAANRVLFHVYQEAMNNILRHGGTDPKNPDSAELAACKAWIHYAPCGDCMELEIKDEGCGFSIPADWAKFASTGAGVVGLKPKVEALGGTLTLTHQPDQGAVIQVRLPRPR